MGEIVGVHARALTRARAGALARAHAHTHTHLGEALAVDRLAVDRQDHVPNKNLP